MDIAITTRGGNMTTAGIKTVLHPVFDLEKAKAVYTALIGICLARFRLELPGALLHRRPLLGAAKMGVGIR
jgi:hypothetical protein